MSEIVKNPPAFPTGVDFDVYYLAVNDNVTAKASSDAPKPATGALVTATRLDLPDEKDIPRRDKLYGNHLVRRFLSGTAAPGGVGKSYLVLGEILSMVTGINYMGDETHYDRLNVWYFNLEDPQDETYRRLAGAIKYRQLDKKNVQQHLFVNSGRDTPLVVATTVKNDVVILEPVVEELIAEIIKNKIDVLIIDPFISSHQVSENDNNAIDRVAKLWSTVAERGNCAVELVHHTKKMGGEHMTEESFRGAKSLVDAMRSARILHPMSASEAASLGVADQPKGYFYTKPEKQTFAPAPDDRKWFKLNSVSLDNGDTVAAVSVWNRPNPLTNITPQDEAAILRELATEDYRADEQAKEWGGYCAAEILGWDVGRLRLQKDRTPEQKAKRYQMKHLLNSLETSGKLFRTEKIDKKSRENKAFFACPADRRGQD